MEALDGFPPELEMGTSMESLQKVLESQKALFHSQIGHLQNIVVTQCKLTGANPLSQEMAAGALFVKIGKRPRDLLNPKAVNYLQSVFSIKDAVTKKEIRDINARFGMTATQIKEYFTNQRSRVRRLVRLSREKAVRNGFSLVIQDGTPSSSEMLPIDPVPLCTVAPSQSEEVPSCSSQNEVLPDIADSDKNFIDNIFSLMRKEETFSGQVRLMEWILQIKNPSVLCWFLTRGGLMILTTWISQAASEEQTSVLYVFLKVLSYLPLSKALPVHMSAVIQSVNRLRFYGKADVSNRARALLSCWSKMFAKGQAIKRLNGIKPSNDAHNEIDLKQRICELMGDELEQPAADISEDFCTRYGNADEARRLEPPQAVKLLTASADDNKRLVLGIPTHKERRKVLLVEQPGQKTPGKNQQVVKAVAASHARPITADEIQKAKLRAQYMQQGKADKAGPASKDSDKSKGNDAKRPSSLLTNDLLSASEAYLRPKLEAHKKAKLVPQKNTKQMEASDNKQTSEPEKKLPARSKRVQIPWQVPPEIKNDPSWKVCAGDNSKDAEVQSNRISREKESVYRTREEVPSNPKEPWDVEMDYDDTLTPEIPLEQLPETDIQEAYEEQLQYQAGENVPVVIPPAAPSASAQPDLELLAVLLKNPELVFALTSGQASGLSKEDTVRLLDLLKNSSGLLNGLAGTSSQSQERPVEVSLPSPTPSRSVEVSLPSPTPASRFDVSLPSPTPSSNAAPSVWRQETAKNPFSRQPAMVPATSSVAIPDVRLQHAALQHQFPASELQVMASAIEQIPSTGHSSSWPHSVSMMTDRQNLTSNPIQPLNHHHSMRDVLPDNGHSRHTNVPAYSPSLSQSPQHMSQSQYSGPNHLMSNDSNKTITKLGHNLASPSFHPQHNQNMYEPSFSGGGSVQARLQGPPQERNQHGVWTGYGNDNSPSRHQDRSHGQGRNYQEQGVNPGWVQGKPDRAWRQDLPGFRDQSSWNGGRNRGNQDRRR